jgi:hypothetical protein
MMVMLTQERLKELATYNPETGLFICAKNRRGSKHKIGDALGSVTNNGYIEIQLDGKRYLAHRLAALAMKGAMPEQVVDHINRNKQDNRWVNLRCVSQVENGHNQYRKPTNNSTGCVGVHRWGGKFRAKINIGKKQIHLGTFENLHNAAESYAQAKANLQPMYEG